MPTVDNNAKMVTVGKPKIGGSVYRAPIGTSLPTDATTALNSAFKCLGYVSADGVKNNNSPESEQIKAWGGDIVLTVMTNRPDVFGMKLIEAMNTDVLKTVYGSANVTGDLADGIAVSVNSADSESASYVVEMIYNNSAVKRIVIPDAKVSEIAEITYANGEVVGYDIKLACVPDSAGNTHYEYIKQTQATPAPADDGDDGDDTGDNGDNSNVTG